MAEEEDIQLKILETENEVLRKGIDALRLIAQIKEEIIREQYELAAEQISLESKMAHNDISSQQAKIRMRAIKRRVDELRTRVSNLNAEEKTIRDILAPYVGSR